MEMRAQQSKHGSMEEEDRLSSLPDDLLHSIIRALPFKHAVRTSALSRRWAPQWLRALASSRVLDFTDPDLARGLLPARAEAATMRRCLDLHAEHGAPLDVLRVALMLPPGSSDGVFGRDVVGWIASAMARGATEVEVYLTPTPRRRRDYDDGSAEFVELPGDLFAARNSLARLALGGFGLGAVPAAPAGLAGLRSLSLSHVDLAGEAVRDVVSSCRALEHLRLSSSGSYSGDLAAIRIASDTLRVLEIVGCIAMKQVWVTAPALESIAFHDDDFSWDDSVDVFFVLIDDDMPALRDVYLSRIGFNHDSTERYFDSLLSGVQHAPVWTLCCDVGYNLRLRFDTTKIQELQLLITYEVYYEDEVFAGFFQENELPLLNRLFLRFPGHLTEAADVDAAALLAGEVVDERRLNRLFLRYPTLREHWLQHDTDASETDAAATLAAAARYRRLALGGFGLGAVPAAPAGLADAAAAPAGEVVDDSEHEFVLDSLSFIKLMNFRGTRFELQLLAFFLKRAPALEHLVLVTVGEEGGEEHLDVIQRQVSAMRKASPQARLTVCRSSEDRSQNPVHMRLYHEE